MQTMLEVLAAIFVIIAAWFLYAGFSADVTVATEAGLVANAQLMHIQATNVAIGLGAAVIAALLLVGAGIIAAIRVASDKS
jgi:hypothetical protein